MNPRAKEVNFDGLIGPTHHYGGLSPGNPASVAHGQSVSSPKEAALQGLGKMKRLHDMGLTQGVILPQERPDLGALRRLGFGGGDAEVISAAGRADPALLASCWSASAMWAANAATVSPSADTADRRVHLTPANLASQFHRSLEAEGTGRVLKAIFRDEAAFAHHPPLPAGANFRDEGAANHLRLCRSHGEAGVEMFVYGSEATNPPSPGSRRHPVRQSREASSALARTHRLDPGRTVLAQQCPAAIDAGVFHNDVIIVGNENFLLCHAGALVEGGKALEELKEKFSRVAGEELIVIEIPHKRLSLAEAVETYLFNSQIVSLPGGGMALIAPSECEESNIAWEILKEIEAGENPIRSIEFVNIRQSMKNGGGPACLRLRVVLTEAELAGVLSSVLLTDVLYGKLIRWVEKHYRDRLSPEDLQNPALIDECRRALDELTRILGLGPFYPFQKPAA
ncbi:MAG: N-succinylarginine dihydrolase [bacterium]